jgi:hypothetical protein
VFREGLNGGGLAARARQGPAARARRQPGRVLCGPSSRPAGGAARAPHAGGALQRWHAAATGPRRPFPRAPAPAQQWSVSGGLTGATSRWWMAASSRHVLPGVRCVGHASTSVLLVSDVQLSLTCCPPMESTACGGRGGGRGRVGGAAAALGEVAGRDAPHAAAKAWLGARPSPGAGRGGGPGRPRRRPRQLAAPGPRCAQRCARPEIASAPGWAGGAASAGARGQHASQASPPRAGRRAARWEGAPGRDSRPPGTRATPASPAGAH